MAKAKRALVKPESLDEMIRRIVKSLAAVSHERLLRDMIADVQKFLSNKK